MQFLRFRRLAAAAVTVGLAVTGVFPPGGSVSPTAASTSFSDVSGHPFEADIAWLAAQGITAGCAPTRFCPDDPVLREQMASFLARALDLPASSADAFSDDESSIHEADINRLAAAGITDGCGGGRFCPRSAVSRQEMASFLARAFAMPATATDYFSDDQTSAHEADINRIAKAGVSTGCSPGRFCPAGVVTRGQMAAFLHRAIDMPLDAPPPAPAGNWVMVVNDQFNAGGVPDHWQLYDGPYGSGPHNCATPSHVSVSGGVMHMLMRHESSGKCGSGWYTAGMMVQGATGGIDQRVTLRFRVVNNGVTSHRVIPMRWPTTATWPAAGEEDYCEDNSLTRCMTFLHYSSSNQQVYHAHTFDQRQWHVFRAERHNHVVRIFVDDMSTPVWTYVGSSATLPDTYKRVVLQQECQSSCPSGSSGSEDIQIDWITIENPA